VSFCVVIPARYAATRLPGKPLLDIAGKPMIQHVHERAQESGAEMVIIATDDSRVQTAAEGFGARVCMTSDLHRSGSDRLAEVVDQLGLNDGQIVVNLQGDEPLMPPAVIHQVADNLAAKPTAGMATVCSRITTAAELFDPHAVKVVMDAEGMAVYFSRAAIPWDRDAFASTTACTPIAPAFCASTSTGQAVTWKKWSPSNNCASSGTASASTWPRRSRHHRRGWIRCGISRLCAPGLASIPE